MEIIQLSFQNEKYMCWNFSAIIVKFPRYRARRKDGQKLWIVRMQVTALLSVFSDQRFRIAQGHCLSYILVVVQVWFIPEQWFHTVSYRNIRFRCVLGTGMFIFLEFPFSVNQCIIYEIEKESMIFSGLSLQEKLWWSRKSILRWIILKGHNKTDGQANI